MSAFERAVAENAIRLGEPKDLSRLIDRISGARVVMLGESSHGTQDFYEWRRLISEWLVVRHGFNFIAVEGDWPACQRLNHFVQAGAGTPTTARETLEAFDRWPTWMWANTEIIRLAEWLRTHNSTLAARHPEKLCGFHGLDVYSFFESVNETLELLERINPFLARRVRHRYACFDPFHADERAYARSLAEFPQGCEGEVVTTLTELMNLRLNGFQDRQDLLFDAQQNARIVRNAEKYYRSMIHGDEDSWNIRDRHMLETLESLLEHYGPESKGIVWAHNTHIGDHRATDMAGSGLVNIGGLARERFGPDPGQVALVGFGTYRGMVTASHAWDGPIEKLLVPPARTGSCENYMHNVAVQKGWKQYYLLLDRSQQELSEVHGHRAIGVVYDPAHERWGNYVPTQLSRRYDAFIYIDETRALEPLIQDFRREDIPETWPVGQ